MPHDTWLRGEEIAAERSDDKLNEHARARDRETLAQQFSVYSASQRLRRASALSLADAIICALFGHLSGGHYVPLANTMRATELRGNWNARAQL